MIVRCWLGWGLWLLLGQVEPLRLLLCCHLIIVLNYVNLAHFLLTDALNAVLETSLEVLRSCVLTAVHKRRVARVLLLHKRSMK